MNIVGMLFLEGGLLDPHIGTIVYVIITFLILLFILGKFAWKPILNGLEEREKRIADAIKKAEDSNKEASEIMAKFDQIIADANAKADQSIRSGKEAAERIRHELVEKAKADAAKLIENAKAEIERDRIAMMQEMKSELVNITISVAEKIIDSNLNDEKNKALAIKSIESFSKN